LSLSHCTATSFTLIVFEQEGRGEEWCSALTESLETFEVGFEQASLINDCFSVPVLS
jgi:hypothetical protein